MAKLKVADVTLVSTNGKKLKKVSMLTLQDGNAVVLSDRMPKKAAVNFVLALVTSSIQKAHQVLNGKKHRRLGRPRKVQSST